MTHFFIVFAATEHPRKQRCGEYISHTLHSNKMTNWFAQSINYNWIYCTLRRFITYEDEIWKSDVRVVTLETQKEHVKSVMPTVLIEEGNIDRKIQKSRENLKKPRSHVLCAKVKDHMAPTLLSGFSNKDIFVFHLTRFYSSFFWSKCPNLLQWKQLWISNLTS